MPNLTLRNPHSILAALHVRPQDVLSVRVPPQAGDSAWQPVVTAARGQGISVLTQGGRQGSGGRHKRDQGRTGAGEADVRPRPHVDIKSLFAGAGETGLWLAFDHLQDPHNVGAIFRTAAFFGVRGVVMTKDRSAPLTATVYDVASGGMEAVPFSVQANLAQSIERAKEAGLWVLGTSEHAESDISQVPRDRCWLLVVGNEQKGLRQLTEKHCDMMCRLSPRGDVTSLNVSVAAGVLIAALTAAAG
jgi:23S rRNA (guanosine2251-2'-O)-methyltransferase